MSFFVNGDDDDPFYDDSPSADPAIKAEYEAALGRLLLEFNQIDFLLSKAIGRILTRLGNPDLADRCSKAHFAWKIQTLELLRYSSEGKAITSFDFEL